MNVYRLYRSSISQKFIKGQVTGILSDGSVLETLGILIKFVKSPFLIIVIKLN